MKKIYIIAVALAVIITSAVIAYNSAEEPSANNEGINMVQGISGISGKDTLIK